MFRPAPCWSDPVVRLTCPDEERSFHLPWPSFGLGHRARHLHSANSGCGELGIRVTTVCEICGFNRRDTLLQENVSPHQPSIPVTPLREKEHSLLGQDRQLL